MFGQEDLTHGQKVGMFYDRMSVFYHTLSGENMHLGYWVDENDQSSLEQAQDHFTDLFIEQIQAAPGSRLLDAGCGRGEPALRIARATDARIVGITISRSQLAAAQDKAKMPELRDRVSFQYADMMSLPFESMSFDNAVALESLIHVPDRMSALREIARVLKPGARFVFSDFVTRNTISPQEEKVIASVFFSRFISPDILMENLRSAGFTTLRSLDLSEGTIRTLPLVVENLQDHRGQLLNNGAMSAEQLTLMNQYINIFKEFMETRVRYLLITAEKTA
jgi:cyclopropane fatty-acyl-phospholipid synthase-like methyltransferase